MVEIEAYDVFLSHAKQDSPWVTQLARRLEDRSGLRVWLEGWDLASPEPLQQAVACGLDQARSCVVCIGAQTPRSWVHGAFERGAERQAQDAAFRVIPLLLPGAKAESVSDIPGLRAWVDMRQGLDMEAYERLVSTIPRVGNPYSAGGMVKDARNFFGRERELRRLRSRLGQGSCTAVVGLRQIGKSSLLYQVAQQAHLLPPGTVAAYLDLQEAAHHEPLGLLNAALYLLQEQLGDRFRFKPVKSLIEFSGAIKRMVAEGHRPVLCLDEMEELVQREAFDDDFFEALRSLGSQRVLAYVTASSQSLDVLLQQGDRSSPFYNLFLNLELAGISDDGARALLTRPFREAGLPEPSAEQIDDVLEWAGHHPFYLQLAAYHLFELQTESGADPPDRRALRDAFARGAERHFQTLWRRLSPAEQAAARRLSGLPAEGGDAEYAIAGLLRCGVAEEEQGGPRLFSALFADGVKSGTFERAWPSPPPPPVRSRQARPARKSRPGLPEMLIALFAALGITSILLALFSPSAWLFAIAGVASLAVIVLVTFTGRRK